MEKLEGIELILFDMEVYKYDWVAGFKIHNTQEYIQIHNSRFKLIEFLNEHREAIFFTINGERYDDNILNTILNDNDPYVTSQLIVVKKRELRAWNLPIVTYDLSKQKTFYPSLKAFESNNGMSIEELPLDPNLDRPLTEEELVDLLRYNRQDLDATEISMVQRMPESIMVKARLIRYFGLDLLTNISKSKGTIITLGLGAKPKKFPHQAFTLDGIFSTLQLKNEKVLDHLINERFYKEDLIIDIVGIKHYIRKGGIHAAKEGYYEAPLVWHVDFASFYPSIMIEYDLLSRALGEDGRRKFLKVREDRYVAKKNKSLDDPALKEVLNSVFGLAGSDKSKLYDPSRAQLVCMYGQAFAIDLTEKLEPYVNMLQSNTDGIIFELKDPSYEEVMRQIIKDFTARTRLQMDVEVYTNFRQKDVNNYVALHEGKVISKGGMTNLWNLTPEEAHYKGTYRLFQTIILDRAVTFNLLYGTKIEQTVQESYDKKEWFRFQATSKMGKMYHRITLVEEPADYLQEIERMNAIIKDKEIKRILRGSTSKKNPDPGFNIRISDYFDFLEQYEDDEFDETQLEVLELLGIKPTKVGKSEVDVQHVNRVFASNDKSSTKMLYKYKWVEDKKTGEQKLSKSVVTGIPKNVFVYNRDMRDFNMADQIDLQWYIDEAKRIVEFYKSSEEFKEDEED